MSDEKNTPPKKLSKLEGYAILAGYPTREEVDIKALTKEYSNSPSQLGGWLGSLVNTNYGYLYLRENGYTEAQISDWVQRTPTNSPETPPNPPHDTSIPTPEGQNNPDTPPPPPSNPPGLTQIPENALNIASLNKDTQNEVGGPTGGQLGISGLSQEQLGQLGMMRGQDGRVYQVNNLANGGYQLNPVTEQQVASAIRARNRQQTESQLMERISERAVDEFNLNIQAIVKKVALSPVVFMSLAYLQAKELAPAEWDLGDFLTHCVNFTMKNGYGAQAGMITGGTTIMDLLRTRDDGRGGFYAV